MKDRKGGRWAWSLCLFLATAVMALSQTEDTTKITAVRNQVAKDAGGTNQVTDVGHEVKPGETVVTGEQGLVEIKSTDSTTVRAGEKSRVSYDPSKRTVKLDQGIVVVDTPAGEEPVKIDVGGATYTISTESSNKASRSTPQNASGSTHRLTNQSSLTKPTNSSGQSIK